MFSVGQSFGLQLICWAAAHMTKHSSAENPARLVHRRREPEVVDSPEKPLHVIYIAGAGRSGSTLFERALETYPGVCSVGELGLLHLVKRFGITLSEVFCPCGAVVAECEHWRELRREAALSDEELEELLRLQSVLFGKINFFLYHVPVLGREFRRDASRLAELTARLYRAAAKIDKSDIVIDSSNYAIGALIAAQMPSIKVHVLHVVRAPEAVVHSWREPKYHPAFDSVTSRRRPLRVLFGWWLQNLMVEALRYRVPITRCSYEEFVAEPRGQTREFISAIRGETIEPSPAFTDAATIDLHFSHALLGNPGLYQAGRTQISADQRFLREQSRTVRWSSVLISLPLRWLYGYGALPRFHEERDNKGKRS